MEKNHPKQNKAYSRLYNYFQKYTPYKWLGKIGLKNVDQEQVAFFLISFCFSILVSASALLIAYIFNFYPDKTPIYIICIIFVALSSWHGGLKAGILTTGIITTGTFLIFGSSSEQHQLNFLFSRMPTVICPNLI